MSTKAKCPFQQAAVGGHEPGGHLGAADVDGEGEICHGRIVTAARSRTAASAS